MRGQDNQLGRSVALKALQDRYRTNHEVVQRFVEEALIAGQLQHPGIVPVYDLGVADGKPFFAMKLIRGRTLQELLRERPEPSRDLHGETRLMRWSAWPCAMPTRNSSRSLDTACDRR